MIGKKLYSNQIFGKILNFFILAILSSTLCACQGSNHYKKLSKEDLGNIKYRGHYKIGNEYTVKNVTYKPCEVKSFTQQGLASWYGVAWHGKQTANGDIYNKNTLSGAHNTLQLPCLVKVTNLANNKSVIIMVNDRGPHNAERIMDLSEKAAEIINVKGNGTAKVKIQYLPKETNKFLSTIGLDAKSGSRSKQPLSNQHCSINCHVKLVNLRHKIKVDKS